MAIAQMGDEDIKAATKKEKLTHIYALLTKIPRAQALVAPAGETRERDEVDAGPTQLPSTPLPPMYPLLPGLQQL